MIKYEAPEGYVFYNGRFLARVVFVNEDSNLEWILLDREQAGNIDLQMDDGLGEAYWDDLQQCGEREDYSYAFNNTHHRFLKPIHSINASNVMYMFMGCSELERADNILIHITSQKPNMMYACANCTKMTTGPLFNFIDVPIVKTYTSMYAGCFSMESVRIYWGDGTADPITQRNSCQNTFYRCKNLKNIDFGDAETGSPIYLDLSWSENLTVLSMNNLLTSLKTIDKTIADNEKSVHEITVSPETYTLLENDAPDILTGFEGKGWTLIIKERENK